MLGLGTQSACVLRRGPAFSVNSLWATHVKYTLNAIWLKTTHVLSHNCHCDSILSRNAAPAAGVSSQGTKGTPRFLRVSAVGFVPRAVRQKIDSKREVLHPASYRMNLDILLSGATLT